jgi:1-acyl-sn-glycerol-3-phosphate acyltransferase
MDYTAVRTAIDRLKHGRLVGVFPEGGLRTGPTSVLEGAPLKPGVAALAQMTQAPVIPCAIIGTDALYNPRRWLPWRNTPVWIVFGTPLAPPAATGDKAEARNAFEKLLGEKIRELYAVTVREEKIPEDCLPQTPQKRKGRE